MHTHQSAVHSIQKSAGPEGGREGRIEMERRRILTSALGEQDLLIKRARFPYDLKHTMDQGNANFADIVTSSRCKCRDWLFCHRDTQMDKVCTSIEMSPSHQADPSHSEYPA